MTFSGVGSCGPIIEFIGLDGISEARQRLLLVLCQGAASLSLLSGMT